jgi:Tol biopolymer transport system component
MYEYATLAPDGRSATVQIVEGSIGLWRLDLAQNTLTPLATSGGSSQAAAWTPDSKRIVYRGTRMGSRELYWRAADGTGDEERLTSTPGVVRTPSSVTPDGEWVVFTEVSPRADRGLFRLHLTGQKEIARVSADASDFNGQVSPDGKWLAFESTSGSEVYVRAYPGEGPRLLVSRSGGTEVRWSIDGRRLYFLKDSRLQVVDVSAGATFSAGAPRPFFSQPDEPFILSPNSVPGYSVSKDGRILRVQPTAPEPPANTINLVLNWSAELVKIVK